MSTITSTGATYLNVPEKVVAPDAQCEGERGRRLSMARTSTTTPERFLPHVIIDFSHLRMGAEGRRAVTECWSENDWTTRGKV